MLLHSLPLVISYSSVSEPHSLSMVCKPYNVCAVASGTENVFYGAYVTVADTEYVADSVGEVRGA